MLVIINKLFLIEMSKLKIFNFVHLRVFQTFSVLYFFSLDWMEEDFGWYIFLFFIAVDIEDTVIILLI